MNGTEIAREMHTDTRIATSEKTAFDGGNTWEDRVQEYVMNNETRWGTNKTNAAVKDWVGGGAMHNIDDRPESHEQFGVALPESVKLPCLFL